MDSLTTFGLFTGTSILVYFLLENGGYGFAFGFASACLVGSLYAFVKGAWPLGLLAAAWAAVALHRWSILRPRR